MCGGYGTVIKKESIAKALERNIREGKDYYQNYLFRPGDLAPVITDSAPNSIQEFKFGMTPSWEKQERFYFNARGEDVVTKPSFRVQIRKKRCVIPATHFIEGTTNEKWKRPYLLFLKRKPFFFAGIWDEWVNPVNEQKVFGFAIITTEPNNVIKSIPHHRSPVILPAGHERTWLNPESPLMKITSLIGPTSEREMDYYPIDPTRIKFKDRSTLEPTGKTYWQKMKEKEDIETSEMLRQKEESRTKWSRS